MEKTREEFIHFIRQAAHEKDSDAFRELYSFLLGCFVRADKRLDGKVTLDEFDTMVEEAAALPRKYGFAPSSEDMFSCVAERKAARAKMFKEMNTHKDGFISLEEWISFSMTHIFGKVDTLPKDPLIDSGVSKKQFIDFIKKAVDKSTQEYRELYFFLLKCFTDADRDHDGAVNPKEFDAMVEEAADAPRRFGLAPETSSMYKTDADRLAARSKEFYTMDINHDGTISFDEWLAYAVKHIAGKVASLKWTHQYGARVWIGAKL